MAGFQDSPFEPARRRAQCFDLAFKADRIARQHRLDPAQYAKTRRWPPERDPFAARGCLARLTLAVVHQQPHADRSDMPSGGCQPAEQRLASLFLIQMKTLRIELRGEGLDVFGRERERAEFTPLPD